jgi:KDO2-lipid IV(A) lauroyltransferase
MSATTKTSPGTSGFRQGIVRAYYASMRLFVRLPFRWQIAIGKGFGRAAGALAGPRRKVVARNLAVCFPELSEGARKRLAREHFAALGAGLAEQAMGWFAPLAEIRKRVRIEGEQHLRDALERGHGVILYSGHYTTIEFCFPSIRPLSPYICGMYKLQRNAAVNDIMRQGWLRSADELFVNSDVRGMLRALKRNAVIWYAADQSAAGKHSALIPFFGEPAMTSTAIHRIASLTGATVLPYYCCRLPDREPRYVMSFGSPVPGFPSSDPVADVGRLNELMAAQIRRCPEQYFWVHKRFKGRPAPLPDLYG